MMMRIIRGALFRVAAAVTALAIRANYAIVRRRIRSRAKGTKIRILFMVNQIEKWKTQSLWDLMEESHRYEMAIGITIADDDYLLTDVEQEAKMDATAAFFEHKGMRTIRLYDAKNKIALSLEELGADIVFYQQPYVILPEHQPDKVSFSALTCYVPYYVTNYGTRHFDYELEFHKHIWRYFILNEEFARAYRRLGWLDGYAGDILGLGHPGLDFYHLNSKRAVNENIVIYAPHWSFDHPKNENSENYSTFLWSGQAILKYAKRHKNLKWVFRPHPALQPKLVESGAWEPEEIEAYWREWESFAIISKNNDFQDLFLQSKALITDCGSFLIEYFVTGKPLLHLISPSVKVKPIRNAKRYFDSWYKIHNLSEMTETFKTVLEDGQDPMREVRLSALRRSHLLGDFAARRILDYLDSTLIAK